MTVQRTTSHEN